MVKHNTLNNSYLESLFGYLFSTFHNTLVGLIFEENYFTGRFDEIFMGIVHKKGIYFHRIIVS